FRSTYILPFKKDLLQETVIDEIKREGQVFYLYNKVSSIHMRVKELKKMFPNLKISFLHGRMLEKDILFVMDEFKKGKIDILVTTTIIENGIDLHNVNTLIIEDASRLGLSQLYQLRGRIGRGNNQAFCYCFYPRVIKEKAKLRLEAIMKANYVGAGYEVSMEDLKIRGAGNLLGKEQSGTINKIGFNLYCQMLNEAVSLVKKSDL
ncbi:MAG: helicase-related protein, partial [Candidatus Pacebacteria bacterium]|nr:helicase-related protein [Candidatus Paceibacterota bacterium]